MTEIDAAPNDVEVLLAGLEVDSVSELRRLVLAAREHESGQDRLTGLRFAQHWPVVPSRVLVVYVAAADEDLTESDELLAGSLARICVKRINRDRKEGTTT